MTKKTAVSAAPEPENRCPNCGYCPHCGRATAAPYIPYPVYPQPYYPYAPWPYRTYTVWNGGNANTFTHTNAVAAPLTYNVSFTS